MQRIAWISKELHRFHKKCKDLQRICNVNFFLTSGVNVHLGGLGGKWTVESDIYSPLVFPLVPFISSSSSGMLQHITLYNLLVMAAVTLTSPKFVFNLEYEI